MTKGPGKTACSIGQDVAYPPGAPGFQDDPTVQSTAKVRLWVDGVQVMGSEHAYGHAHAHAHALLPDLESMVDGALRACGTHVRTCASAGPTDRPCLAEVVAQGLHAWAGG